MSIQTRSWAVWLLCAVLLGCGDSASGGGDDKPGDEGGNTGNEPMPEPEPEPKPDPDAGMKPVEDPLADLPKEEVKSELELTEDSFSFPNFAGTDPRASVTPKLAARMFGPTDICASIEGDACRATPLARTWTQNINLSMQGGRCEGFAILSALFAMGELNPADFGGTKVSDIEVEGNEPINREIAYWFSSQYLPSVRKNSRRMTAVETIKTLVEEFRKPKGEADMFRIGMVRLDENGKPSGGHAVMPYAIALGDVEGQYKIKIYDNNHPQEDRFLTVDAMANRWEYQASSNPSEPASLYAGDLTNDNQLYLASVRIRMGEQECPFCAGTEEEADQYFSQVFTLGSASVVAEDENGKQAGVMDGEFVNTIPNAKVLPSYSADPWRDDTLPVINLPASKRTKLRLTGNGGSGGAGITIVGRGYTAGVDGAKIGKGNSDEMTVEQGGKGISYVPSSGSAPTLFAGVQNKNGTQTLVRIALPEGVDLSSVNIAIDPETGNVGLSAKSESGVELEIEVTRSTADGEDLFEGTVLAPEDGAVEVEVEEWEGEGTPIEVAVDEDGDGTFEDTVVVDDTGPVNEPPYAPANLGLTSIALDAVGLTWLDISTNETGFLLERDEGNGFAPIAQLGANENSYVDANVFRATTYEYRVRSFNEYGDSEWSLPLQVVTPDCPMGTQDNEGNNVCTATCATSGLDCGDYGSCGDNTGLAQCNCDGTHTGSLCTLCVTGTQDNDSNGSCTATCAMSGLNCGANGICTDDSGSTVCACNVGYTGTLCNVCDAGYQDNDGNGTCDQTCSESGLNCGAHGSCGDTTGVALCVCDVGYEGDTCGTCPNSYQDNDSNSTCNLTCAASGLNCGSHGDCSDGSGTALCDCAVGYGGATCGGCAAGFQDNDSDGLCTETCATSGLNCGAHGTCSDATGDTQCICQTGHVGAVCGVCDVGYQDNNDDGLCSPSCATSGLDCGSHGECTDLAGIADCSCEGGYAGGLCNTCAAGYQDNDGDGLCSPTCATSGLNCGANGACSDGTGVTMCDCNSGFSGVTFCSDINECLSNNGGCDSLTACVNTQGSRSCTACPSGYSGTGATSCVDINECSTGNGGCDALTACTNTAGSRTCGACPGGYTGTGATSCVDINECSTGNGGCDALTACTNTAGSRTCGACPGGYTGTGATSCVDINECSTGNGGCDALTACTNTAGSRTCGACPGGYAGTGATSCVDINECSTGNGGCDALTACTNTAGSRTCGACPGGYTGTGATSCVDINECSTGNGGCDALTACTNTAGSRTCGACPGGYTGTGATSCVDINECSTGNGGCDALTACTNTAGSRTCGACPGGYTGTGATSCVDINECSTGNGGCDALTACTNTAGSRTCGACPGGYTGTGATSCVDINECSTGNGGCDALTACTNTAGSRTCGACPGGYTGTGATSCVDINECATGNGGCDALTACTNTAGSRTCGACPGGYTGTGATSCTNINECAGTPCTNGSCIDTPGSYTCSCDGGYDDCSGDQACETNVMTDVNHCGVCGAACNAGQACIGAVCVTPPNPCPVPPGAQLAFAIDMPVNVSWGNPNNITYLENNRAALSALDYDRVGFCMLLDGTYAYAEMDDYTSNNINEVGIPSDFVYKTSASNLTVSSNSPNVTNLTGATASLEMWPSGYNEGANGVFDYDDGGFGITDGYGSFQIHNGTQTVMAWNRWGATNDTSEGGIGNAPSGQPDWTFAVNSGSYATRRLYGYVIDSDALPVTAGLSAHYTALASSSVTRDGSNNVSQWNDLSGNGRHLTVSGGAPIYNPTLINGQPGLSFAGAKRMITSAFPLTTDVTVFAVIQYGTPATWGAIAHHGDRDGDWSLEQSGFDGSNIMHFQSVNDNTDNELTFATGTNYVVAGRISGTNRYFSASTPSGTVFDTATGNSIGAGNKVLYVGQSDANEASNAFIGELVYYNRALSDSERDQVIAHLRTQWGLDPVPAPPPGPGENVLNGIHSGGYASVVEMAGYNGASLYNYNLALNCTNAWQPQGALCDEPATTHSKTQVSKSDENSGSTWLSGGSNGIGVAVIDAGRLITFNEARAFQMFADGRTTHFKLFVHPQTSSAPAWNDAGWVAATGFEPLGVGASNGGSPSAIFSAPTVINLPSQTTRYVKIEARNDGSQGWVNYIQFNALKLFNNADLAGLQHCWGAENNASDSIGTNDASIGPGVSYTAGRSGQGFSCNGSSGNQTSITAGDRPAVSPTGPFTYDFWINRTSSTGDAWLVERVYAGFSGSGNPLVDLHSDSGGNAYWSIRYDAGPSITTGGFTLPAGWIHLAVTRGGGLWKTYKNGVLISQHADSGAALTPDPVRMCGHADSAGSYMTGGFDSFRIWGRELSAAEVANVASGDGSCSASPSSNVSCLAIKTANPGATSGTYTIDPDGVGPVPSFNAYCDMTTDGGGWTIVNAITGADGEQPLVSDAEVTGSNPLSFQHYNLNRAKKVALTAISTTSIFVRNDSTWIKVNRGMFDANLDVASTHAEYAVTVTANNGVSSGGYIGYSNYGYASGGDFGVTNSAGFDHHAPGSYHHLNGSCVNSYLYSYSAGADSDAGYDVNYPLGSWAATDGCNGNEGGSLVFYSAMR